MVQEVGHLTFPSGCEIIRFNTEAEWLHYRSSRIAGSEIPGLMGKGKYGSPYALWDKLVNGPKTIEYTRLMFWGKMQEETAAKGYEALYDKRLVTLGPYAVVVHPQNDRICATLDYVEVDENNYPVQIFEAKSADRSLREFWKTAPPTWNAPQVLMQLEITGLKRGVLFGLVGGNEDFSHTIQYDSGAAAEMMWAAERMLERADNREPPVPDGHQSTRDALMRFEPEEGAVDVVPPDTNWLDLYRAATYLRAAGKAQVKEAETSLAKLQNQVLLEVNGKATFARIAGFGTAKFSPAKKTPTNAGFKNFKAKWTFKPEGQSDEEDES